MADAAGNDLLRVWPNGHIKTVARLKPRTVKVPPGLRPGGTRRPGRKMLAEAVATSVTVGSDGYWYVGELRGFPATPGTSQIWRIKPGSYNAVCDPAKPYKGKCTRYADGYTSIVDLAGGPQGTLAVVELAKVSWLQWELGGSARRFAVPPVPGQVAQGRVQEGACPRQADPAGRYGDQQSGQGIRLVADLRPRSCVPGSGETLRATRGVRSTHRAWRPGSG